MITHPVALPARYSRRGFTLVEMLVVMTILILMVGLSMSAFKGGASVDATKGASVVAASEFDAARNEAIMRQTISRVIIDTAWMAGRTDLADHYLRRMTVAYLNPLGVDANGIPAATSGQPVDPDSSKHPANWVQSGAWTILPGNVYFDINYSVLHGTGMSINFAGSAAPAGGYCYYQFSPNGQTQSTPLAVFAPSASNGSVNTTPAQCVLSTGSVNASMGTFQERGSNGSSAQATAPTSCYGFVLFRMGHMSFFRDNSEIQQPS